MTCKKFFTVKTIAIITALILLAFQSISYSNAPADSSTRKVVGLTILIKFPDSPSQEIIHPSHISQMINRKGYNYHGNNGSVHDYYYDISSGKFDYTSKVTNYYTAKHPKAYYDIDVKGGRTQELITEALEYFRDIRKLDLSQFDLNKDGTVDALTIMYTGKNTQMWGNGLWPHSNRLYQSFTAGNTKIESYVITPIFFLSYIHPTIGLLVHELAHMLFGWPDLYSNNSTNHFGSNGLMGFGNNLKNPLPPNPYFLDHEKWVSPISLNSINDTTCSIHANSLNSVFKILNPKNPREKIYVQNRTRSGRYVGSVGEGLIMFHVVEPSDTKSLRGLKVSTIQADNAYEIEGRVNTGDPLDFFYQGHNNTFTSYSQPQAIWSDQSELPIHIVDISSPGSEMTFKVVANSPAKPESISENTILTMNAHFRDNILHLNTQEELHNATLELYSIDGALQHSTTIEHLPGSITLSHMSQGSYFAFVKTDKKIYRAKNSVSINY